MESKSQVSSVRCPLIHDRLGVTVGVTDVYSDDHTPSSRGVVVRRGTSMEGFDDDAERRGGHRVRPRKGQ